MHLGISKAAFENGRDWPWPSRSFCTLTDKRDPKCPCHRDNSPPVSARITKFAPIVHLRIGKAAFEYGRNWPWPSRSFWTLTDQFSQNGACLQDNLSRIRSRISKFTHNVYIGTLCQKRVNWPWPSRSFTSNVYIDISQERVDRLTSGENYFDRWVTEKNLHVIKWSLNLTYSLSTDLLVI